MSTVYVIDAVLSLGDITAKKVGNVFIKVIFHWETNRKTNVQGNIRQR